MEVDPGSHFDLGTCQMSRSIKNKQILQTLSIIATERQDSKRSGKALMPFSLKATFCDNLFILYTKVLPVSINLIWCARRQHPYCRKESCPMGGMGLVVDERFGQLSKWYRFNNSCQSVRFSQLWHQCLFFKIWKLAFIPCTGWFFLMLRSNNNQV